jgi:hypothetical protein
MNYLRQFLRCKKPDFARGGDFRKKVLWVSTQQFVGVCRTLLNLKALHRLRFGEAIILQQKTKIMGVRPAHCYCETVHINLQHLNVRSPVRGFIANRSAGNVTSIRFLPQASPISDVGLYTALILFWFFVTAKRFQRPLFAGILACYLNPFDMLSYNFNCGPPDKF